MHRGEVFRGVGLEAVIEGIIQPVLQVEDEGVAGNPVSYTHLR